jgi:hypothetical protein
LRVTLTVAVLLVVLTVASTVSALAADPSPAASGVLIDPLDPRAGAGANRVGAPLLALGAVVAIGVLAAVVTAVYVRLKEAR